MVRAGHRQHRRRLLRHHSGAYSGHCGGSPWLRTARHPRGRAPHPPRRHRADGAGRLTMATQPEDVSAPEATLRSTFVNIGERTNVTGSAAFKKLIMADDYAKADI